MNKQKIVHILNLLKETDEQHPINCHQILEKLEKNNIFSERKSVSRDIKVLSGMGYDIKNCVKMQNGYYMAKHEFEDWEIKILIDGVCAQSFLSLEDSKNLQNKLLKLLPVGGRETVSGCTFCPSVRYSKKPLKHTFEKIITAIRNKKKIKFKCGELQSDKQYHLMKKGECFVVNPYTLIIHDGFYFLVCNHDKNQTLIHYRLDKMIDIEIIDDNIRSLADMYKEQVRRRFNDYLCRSFYMYNNSAVHLELKCPTKKAGNLFDRFGEDVEVRFITNEYFTIAADVMESDALYMWLMKNPEIKVIRPSYIRNELIQLIRNTLEEAMNL